ncbi:MAG: LamG domain-containing protein [Pirellulales bacterium]|nr:LamG domain-containing protein [Pirellulales bacterium]
MKSVFLPVALHSSILVCLAQSLQAASEGVVAEYRFDRVTDNQTADTSGQGNNGIVHGARPIQDMAFQGLQFDGQDDYVDCGAGESLDLRKQVTVECWVRPSSIPSGEVGIAGKGLRAFALTYYKDGHCRWYLNDGTNNVKVGIATDIWQHIVGVFDGSEISLYLNAKLAGCKALKAAINPTENLFIGSMPDRSGFFHGAVAQVRIYNRALSADEVAQRYAPVAKATTVEAKTVTGGAQLDGPHYNVRLGSSGAIQVNVTQDRYVIESAMSFPGDAIGWNRLAADKNARAVDVVNRGDAMSVDVPFDHYRLSRTVRPQGHRVIVEDTLTNTAKEDIGILYRNELTTPQMIDRQYLGGAPQATGHHLTAENPSLFCTQPTSRLGWLAEDDVYRLQLELAAQGNFARMSANRFALRPGASHTFRWTIYPLPAKADYWDFVNQVRRDWDVNSAILGSFDFIEVTRISDLIAEPQRLRAALERKKLKVIAAMPWLDYDNHNFLTGKPTSREEYKAMMRKFRQAVRAIDPTICVIGCMEGNLVSLPEPLVQEMNRLALNKAQNQYIFTDEQLAALRRYDIRWKDCLLMNEAGKFRYELYYRGEIPYASIAVFAAPGNDQHRYWLEQARYMIEEVGLDGIYIDQFNMAFDNAQRYSHHAWDGTTVDIDRATGRITRQYTDAALVGIDARRSLADYVVGRERFMLANTFPATQRMQSVRIHRFNESEWFFNPAAMGDDEEPPASYYPTQGHFSTPIGLGFRPERLDAQDQYARTVMKGAIAYLRNGMLYFYYGTQIPESGPGAGEYGPLNRMFPFTPVELHSGWLVGKERTISCVSGTIPFLGPDRPSVHVFDLRGAPVELRATINREGRHWRVDLKIRDWAEIAVIE